MELKCPGRASSVVTLDALGRPERPTGVSVVSVCDSYEVVDDRVVPVISYGIEGNPGDPSPATVDRRDWDETVDDA